MSRSDPAGVHTQIPCRALTAATSGASASVDTNTITTGAMQRNIITTLSQSARGVIEVG